MGKSKRSRSRSRERDYEDRKNREKIKIVQDQIENLTRCMTEFLQSQNNLEKSKNQPEAVIEDVTQVPNKERVSNELKNIDEGEEILVTKVTSVKIDNESLGLTDKPKEIKEKDITDLDPEFLEMVGEEIPSTNSFIKVNDGIEKQWKDWMYKGLSEESRKNILKKYSRNGEFRTEARKINLEISSHLSDIAKKRDQHFVDTQNCVGTAILSLGAAVSMVVGDPEEEIDQEQLIKYLWDTGKILADAFHQQSTSRKSFITPSLDKEIKPTLEATVSDEWLYGEKLTDQVKEAKTIKKASASLKNTEKAFPKKVASQGNWRGPPSKYRQVGYYPRKQFTNGRLQSRPYPPMISQNTGRQTNQGFKQKITKK